MLCDWLDTIFVRYILLIVVVCTVTLICTVVHFFGTMDNDNGMPQRKCLSIVYIATMCVCISALILLNGGMMNRLGTQLKRVAQVLGTEATYSNTPLWDSIQRNYECCGSYNATDWGCVVPSSCCSEYAPPVRMSLEYIPPSSDHQDFVFATNECSLYNAYPTGCVEALTVYLQNVAKYVSLLAFAFMCFGMMGGLASCLTEFRCYMPSHPDLRPSISVTSV